MLDLRLLNCVFFSSVVLTPFCASHKIMLVGEGTEFLREAIESIAPDDQKRLLNLSQPGFLTPPASPARRPSRAASTGALSDTSRLEMPVATAATAWRCPLAVRWRARLVSLELDTIPPCPIHGFRLFCSVGVFACSFASPLIIMLPGSNYVCIS